LSFSYKSLTFVNFISDLYLDLSIVFGTLSYFFCNSFIDASIYSFGSPPSLRLANCSFFCLISSATVALVSIFRIQPSYISSPSNSWSLILSTIDCSIFFCDTLYTDIFFDFGISTFASAVTYTPIFLSVISFL